MLKSAVAYYRTSSATNVGDGKDSMIRQKEAILKFGLLGDYDVVREFYDAAVSGADPIDQRPGFMELLAFCAENDVKTILVENASRFARDLMVQLTGHALLKERGIELVPVDAPSYFTDPTPTAVLIQQILGAVSQFEKAALVAKLKHARDRKREATGRCEGRKPVPPQTIAEARRLSTLGFTLREISNLLANGGFVGVNGRPYLAGSIAAMLKD